MSHSWWSECIFKSANRIEFVCRHHNMRDEWRLLDALCMSGAWIAVYRFGWDWRVNGWERSELLEHPSELDSDAQLFSKRWLKPYPIPPIWLFEATEWNAPILSSVSFRKWQQTWQIDTVLNWTNVSGREKIGSSKVNWVFSIQINRVKNQVTGNSKEKPQNGIQDIQQTTAGGRIYRFNSRRLFGSTTLVEYN